MKPTLEDLFDELVQMLGDFAREAVDDSLEGGLIVGSDRIDRRQLYEAWEQAMQRHLSRIFSYVLRSKKASEHFSQNAATPPKPGGYEESPELHDYWLRMKEKYGDEQEQVPASDLVNHPSHYTYNGIECIDVTRHMSFCAGNAMKYLWRHEHKGNPVEDLKKARKYLDWEIERLEKQA